MLDRKPDGNVNPDNNSELFYDIGQEVAKMLHLRRVNGKFVTANGEKRAAGIGRLVYSICQEHIVKAS